MTIGNIKKILNDYKEISSVAVLKTIITKEGVNSFINEKDFKSNFENYRMKYAVKKPKSINYEVLDRSSDRRVIPSEVILENEKKEKCLVKLRFNPKASISLAVSKDNGKTRVKLLTKNKKLINGIPIKVSLLEKKGDSVVSLLGKDRLSVIIFDGCWNWNTGKQCHFCDLNPKRAGYKSVIPTLNDIPRFDFDYKTWWQENKNIFFKELEKSFKKNYPLAKPHKHLLIMAGGFINNQFLWQIVMEFVEKLNSIKPLKSTDNYLNVPPPSENIEEKFQRLKKLGIKKIQINLEVIGKKRFQEVCPGKAEGIGYHTFKNALEVGVKIFGRGNSRSNFVFTSGSSKKMLKEAIFLAREGIVMDYSIFQPKRGTPWANKKSPSTREILDFSKSLAKIYKKNKFEGIYCNLSSRSSIINELLKYGY